MNEKKKIKEFLHQYLNKRTSFYSFKRSKEPRLVPGFIICHGRFSSVTHNNHMYTHTIEVYLTTFFYCAYRYGYITNTRVKLVVVVSVTDGIIRDADMKAVI